MVFRVEFIFAFCPPHPRRQLGHFAVVDLPDPFGPISVITHLDRLSWKHRTSHFSDRHIPAFSRDTSICVPFLDQRLIMKLDL